jgi:hypothetical protein
MANPSGHLTGTKKPLLKISGEAVCPERAFGVLTFFRQIFCSHFRLFALISESLHYFDLVTRPPVNPKPNIGFLSQSLIRSILTLWQTKTN